MGTENKNSNSRQYLLEKEQWDTGAVTFIYAVVPDNDDKNF